MDGIHMRIVIRNEERKELTHHYLVTELNTLPVKSHSTQLPLCARDEIDVFEATEVCEPARCVEERGVNGASAPGAVPRVVGVDGGRQEIPGRKVE